MANCFWIHAEKTELKKNWYAIKQKLNAELSVILWRIIKNVILFLCLFLRVRQYRLLWKGLILVKNDMQELYHRNAYRLNFIFILFSFYFHFFFYFIFILFIIFFQLFWEFLRMLNVSRCWCCEFGNSNPWIFSLLLP